MNRNQALLIVASVLIFGLIATCYGAYELATVSLGFNIPEELEVEGYLNGEPITSSTSLDFEDVTTDSTYNLSLDFHNSGNVDAVVSLDVTKPTDWTVTYPNDGSTISVNSWLNGTLSVYIPPQTGPGSYEVTFSINIDKASETV